jgi:DnaJ-class molecular chaperone
LNGQYNYYADHFSFMQNPYQTLGVDRNSSPEDIKRAYRRLASQHHPDKGGDKARFQEIQSAYDMLTNPQKRAAHDNPSPFGHPGFNFNFGAGDAFDFQSIFNSFGTRFQHQQQRPQQARMSLWVTLEDVAHGGRKSVSVASSYGNHTIEIEIPLGINDGDTVQYQQLGPAGTDLLITFRIHPNPRWHRQGPNLTNELAVSIWDLILGTEVTVQDILGSELTLTIPPRTQPGTIFRLRGRGLRQRSGGTGDLLVKILGQIPENISEDLIRAIEQNQNQ